MQRDPEFRAAVEQQCCSFMAWIVAADKPVLYVTAPVDKPAGMVSATAPGREGAIELISMWVSPFVRGHGVGDAAVGRVLTWAHAEQGGAPVVLSVKTRNVPAIQLYRRHGFTDAGASPDDPSERLMRR